MDSFERRTTDHHKFPRNLFQIWFQGIDHLQTNELNFYKNCQHWKLLNPEWDHFIIDEIELEKACLLYSKEALDHFQKLRKFGMIMAIDFGRYCLLYQKGGMYIDVDTYPLQPIESSSDVSLPIQEYCHGHRNDIMLISQVNQGVFTFDDKSRLSFFNNGMMIASPKHPILNIIIQDCINKTIHTPLSWWMTLVATGPISTTYSIRKSFQQDPFLESTVIILKPTVFEPCDLSRTCDITDDTISIHYHKQSWVPNTVQCISKFLFLTFYWLFHYFWLWFFLFLIIMCMRCYRHK